MTYLEAAKDIIEMYNNYAVLNALRDDCCGDHSEAVAMAVEALSIVSGMEVNPERKRNKVCDE